MALPLTGGGGCGTVRFEIFAPLTAAAYCHCTRFPDDGLARFDERMPRP
ncbi:MAG: hypothetical protein M3375_01210 [Actinomycetota bacterium]|nr:hypothetical protein [Actinomycetota bacterium]